MRRNCANSEYEIIWVGNADGGDNLIRNDDHSFLVTQRFLKNISHFNYNIVRVRNTTPTLHTFIHFLEDTSGGETCIKYDML